MSEAWAGGIESVLNLEQLMKGVVTQNSSAPLPATFLITHLPRLRLPLFFLVIARDTANVRDVSRVCDD